MTRLTLLPGTLEPPWGKMIVRPQKHRCGRLRMSLVACCQSQQDARDRRDQVIEKQSEMSLTSSLLPTALLGARKEVPRRLLSGFTSQNLTGI